MKRLMPLVLLTFVGVTTCLAGEGPRPAQAELPNHLSTSQLNVLWAELAGEDAETAYRAIQTLIAAPKQSVPFLRERLQPVPVPDAKRIATLIAQLDAKEFRQREQAAKQLAELGDLAEPALAAAMDKRPSLELRQRLEKLLAPLPMPLMSGETLRQIRAIEVLDVIGSPEAVRVLQQLATGAAGARSTREAKAALERSAKKKADP